LVDERCTFRTLVLGALSDEDIPWRTVFESGSIEATATTVRAGLAVTTSLVSTVSPDLETIVPCTAGLPALPPFAICLQLPSTMRPAALQFAHYVRETMSNNTAIAHSRLSVLA
jgi:DNA-binding transcriptional LysR family regulator